jgi:Skp family chaperone for outer membrane proteins
MKRFFALVSGLFLAVCFFSSVYAGDSVGFVDLDRVMQGYKAGEKVLQELKTKREDYQKFLAEKQVEIDKARENKESEAKIKERIAKMEGEIRPKQEEILRRESETQRSFLAKILETTKIVAKDYGIEVVLEKRAVLLGGFDLTEFVVDKLNK